MTTEEYKAKKTTTTEELLSLTQEQMEEISKFDGKRKRGPLTYAQRLKMSLAQKKRHFENHYNK